MFTVRYGTFAAVTGALVLLFALTRTAGVGVLGWLTALTVAAATNLLLVRALRRRDAVALHLPNRVTLTRATLVAVISGLVADGALHNEHTTTVVTLSTIALLLDFADGQIARRTNHVTELGARFDMEVDAFLILVLSCYVAPLAGAWVLAIGGARYGYVATGWLLPWLRSPVPPRYWRKVVAAVQGVVLTTAAAQVLPSVATELALVAALALLTESFGRDVWWLWLRRRVPARRRWRARAALAGSR